MKFLIVFVALFAIALAAPDVEIVIDQSEVKTDGYKSSVEDSDGTIKFGEGELALDDEEQYRAVKGSFPFVADDGQTYTTNYNADKNEGAHLPKA